MASDNKYDLPLLSDMHPRSNENVNPRLKTFASRTWSISFSIPMSSESYQNETNLVCFTAPLLAESRTPEIQMSSPLLISPISRNLFQPGHGVTGRKLLEPKTQTFPSCKAKDQNDRMDDKQGGNNEHLSRGLMNVLEMHAVPLLCILTLVLMGLTMGSISKLSALPRKTISSPDIYIHCFGDSRRLEMSLRRHDIEQWMRHRRLPPELRRQVLEAERCIWDATRGVNEEKLLENLPEDLQKDIRRHLFKFVKEIPIFEVMDESILDAISGRLKQKIYTKGRQILRHGGVIEKKIFIVRGKLESVGEDEIRAPLIEGDVCGEELLPWCLEQYLVNKDPKNIRIPGQQLLSDRRVKCLTNVEAFSLRAADLEEVISLYTRFLLNPGVQRAISISSVTGIYLQIRDAVRLPAFRWHGETERNG
ncbi:hypothetical protein HS088_TW15G00098 [Tripterygium wilfordii]|uniref:Cyclic nucleotide-binding domain-containing protein n=1 Tax=Tripterygium wilfordii TaxID=458696 RepID=A0A7J7CKV7_TRIWF|nr:hypothetical protein HS088_TW15G00098 [Tripterygium wilfordii]